MAAVREPDRGSLCYLQVIHVSTPMPTAMTWPPPLIERRERRVYANHSGKAPALARV